MDNTLEMFGLTKEQLEVMYSLEYLLTKHDLEENSSVKVYNSKRQWLTDWWLSLQKANLVGKHCYGVNEDSFAKYAQQISSESFGKTWFNLIVLEAIAFTPYFPLDENQENKNRSSKLKYSRDTIFLKRVVALTRIVDSSCVDRFAKTYSSVYRKISNKASGLLVKGIVVLAVSAVGAALAATFAGPIAVLIFGEQFAGLSGAALINACLAMAGGGAIAVGGAGIAGGVAAIAGGGALLGFASGGAAVATLSSIAKKSPEFTLTQSAKLEVVLREILLNEQKDIVTAQTVLESLQKQIFELNNELSKLKAENEKDKKAISNLETSVKMMKYALTDMTKFKGAFEVGLASSI